ncbi:hypothetical protein ES703_118919 [subsurface metagenome]
MAGNGRKSWLTLVKEHLVDIKGAGWTTETLKAIKDAIDAIPAGGDATEAKQDAIQAALGTHDTDIKALLATIAGYIDTEIAAIKAVVDAGGYFEQTVPIKMNCTQTITATKGDKVFIAAGATGASGLISIDDAKVQKVMLLIIGRAVNAYAGTNALDCSAADGTPADNNQWQMNLDGGAYSDLANEEADGQQLDDDWRCPVEGAIHPFTLMFDVDTELTNIDGKIGVQLKDARSEQDSLIVTIDVYLKILWKL